MFGSRAHFRTFAGTAQGQNRCFYRCSLFAEICPSAISTYNAAGRRDVVVSTCSSPSRKLFSSRESGIIGVYASAMPGISSQKKRTGHLKVKLAITRSLREFLSGRMCTSLTASWIRSKRVCSSAPYSSSGMWSSSSEAYALRPCASRQWSSKPEPHPTPR